MRQTILTKAAQVVVELKIKAAEAYIKEVIEPLEQVGSPEKLIGKEYSDWTPEDLQMLSQVYGESDDSPLAKLIFNKSYQEVQTLEEE